jgi:UDP-glucose 4-epimerase
LCCKAAGVPNHPLEFQPKRPGEVERNFASYELAHKLLGYAPSIGREEGIADTWKWFCDFVFGH